MHRSRRGGAGAVRCRRKRFEHASGLSAHTHGSKGYVLQYVKRSTADTWFFSLSPECGTTLMSKHEQPHTWRTHARSTEAAREAAGAGSATTETGAHPPQRNGPRTAGAHRTGRYWVHQVCASKWNSHAHGLPTHSHTCTLHTLHTHVHPCPATHRRLLHEIIFEDALQRNQLILLLLARRC